MKVQGLSQFAREVAASIVFILLLCGTGEAGWRHFLLHQSAFVALGVRPVERRITSSIRSWIKGHLVCVTLQSTAPVK